MRTIIIDDTDVYTLIPHLESYRSEIATQVRGALEGQQQGNPISVFFPKLEVGLRRNVPLTDVALMAIQKSVQRASEY